MVIIIFTGRKWGRATTWAITSTRRTTTSDERLQDHWFSGFLNVSASKLCISSDHFCVRKYAVFYISQLILKE